MFSTQGTVIMRTAHINIQPSLTALLQLKTSPRIYSQGNQTSVLTDAEHLKCVDSIYLSLCLSN